MDDHTVRIGRHPVAWTDPVLTIAELGLNHGGSCEQALEMVDRAARAGARAVKLQTLRASTLVAPDCPPPAHVSAASLQSFFAGFELDEPGHRAVARRAAEHGLAFVSTPLDEEAVEMLERVGCDAYKIASGDLTHLRLIAAAARTGKPVILSTGMSSLDEVENALRCARDAGASAVVLLHCVSAYPTPHDQQNLAALAALGAFGVPIGLSDHGRDDDAPVVAVALGARIYERHFVLDDDRGAVDRAVSSAPADLAARVRRMEATRRALGHGARVPMPAELPNVRASRRSLYAARALAPGQVIDASAVAALRPASGLALDRWADLVGRRVRRPIAAGQPFVDDDLADATFAEPWNGAA